MDALPYDIFCTVASHLGCLDIMALQVNRKMRKVIATREFWAMYMASLYCDGVVQNYNVCAGLLQGAPYHPSFMVFHSSMCIAFTTLVKCVIPFSGVFLHSKRHDKPCRISDTFVQMKQYNFHDIVTFIYGNENMRAICRHCVLSYVNKNGEWELVLFLHPVADADVIAKFAEGIISVRPSCSLGHENIMFDLKLADDTWKPVHVLAIHQTIDVYCARAQTAFTA